MKKPNQILKRAGQVVAGVNVLFNLSATPKPPDLHELESQWAKNEKVNVLPQWQNRARELGYDLREPVSGGYRSPDEPTSKVPASRGDKTPPTRDVHDQALSQRPERGQSRSEHHRGGRAR